MNIVMAHNHYQAPGGEDESFRAETQMLRDVGHRVETYTQHNDRVEKLGQVRTAVRTLWSQETYRDVRSLLRTAQADVLHVQNFFPLISPSIYYAARAEGIPVVQSLRNYRLLCPNALFFRDGHVCEDCLGKTIQWPGVVHRCYRGSGPASATVAAMNGGHRIASTWSRLVTTYIALTEFARDKYLQGGLPADKIVVKPNFVFPDPGAGAGFRDGVLYVGRLTPEKGIPTLLAAWDQLRSEEITLRIVGDGPSRALVEQAAAENDMIEYLGGRSITEVYALMARSTAVIVPSEWYETFGRVVIESFAKGTPVIASRIGAIGEVVDDFQTGLLFEPGNTEDLARAVTWAFAHPEQWKDMGTRARRRYELSYTAAANHGALIDIYERAMRQART